MEGDKVDRLLARLTQFETLIQPAVALSTNEGWVVTALQALNKVYKDYLRQVYTAPLPTDIPTHLDYLAGLTLPTLSGEDREALEAPLNKQEIKRVIDSMKTTKVPGGDGLPAVL
ncbi:hypothetical protein NDU88_001481 [Pleurodeles waltl]|uniref:Uncharacterized protein n=1 Tax=Pleurodeles waltl TaxID=8319 RepID=A0AAV7P3X1_PLEWA|nr:hypothetical protein NDU88_001481 [Pleurodeles waltl]